MTLGTRMVLGSWRWVPGCSNRKTKNHEQRTRNPEGLSFRRLRQPHRPRGAVLLLVLCAVAILAILAVDLAHRANLESSRCQRSARDAAFRRCSDSGVELAAGLLGEGRDTQGCDYLGDAWNRRLSVALNATEQIDVAVADESGKLNLLVAMSNADGGKTRKSLARLFAYLRAAEPQRDAAWRDIEERLHKRLGVGAAPSVGGPPMPLYTLNALREAGISSETIFGPAVMPAATAQAASAFALSDLLTVFGDGKINLNTAPVPVLYSIDEEFDAALAAKIAAWRTQPAENKQPANEAQPAFRPFQKPGELERVEGIVAVQFIDGHDKIVKNLFAKVQSQVSVSSRCFRARIASRIGERKRVAFVFFETGAVTNGAVSEARTARLIVREELAP